MDAQKTNYQIPIAIVIAGIIIAGAIIYSTGKNDQPADVKEVFSDNVLDKVKPFSASDHILGNSNAPVKIIEFSDTECPFCKRFHLTMHQAVDEYKGKVAWVYRHFPLDSLHSKARKEAEAVECAAELGGNDKFWAYLDRLFEITPSNNGLDAEQLPEIAVDVGLDKQKFESCLKSGRHAARVEADYQDAIASGGRGTPYSIAITSNGEKSVINGAQPFSSVKQIIDAVLNLK